MRAFHVTAPGELELRDMPMPVPGPGEIVLGIRAALTCGTDLKLFRRGHPKMPFPTRMGHEFAGVVVAAGPGARFAEGDEIMSVHTAPCGTCGLCLRGAENLCDQAMSSMTLGGFADLLLLPRPVVDVNAFLKPASLAWEHAAFLEPLSCVVQGLEKVAVRPGESVVILGAGPIGLMQQLLVKAAGAGTVVMVGRRAPRLDAARELGADAVLDEQSMSHDELRETIRGLTHGLGADVVIECVATPEGWELATTLARKGGRVLWFGGCKPGTHVTLDTRRVHYDEITTMGVFHFAPRSVAVAQRLLASGEIDVAPLVSGTMPLEDLPLALDLIGRGEGVKYALLPGLGKARPAAGPTA
jgi:L-iditol 2-dehydrogenase